nr:hypothetical protein [Tanacetum cinerariifolium]
MDSNSLLELGLEDHLFSFTFKIHLVFTTLNHCRYVQSHPQLLPLTRQPPMPPSMPPATTNHPVVVGGYQGSTGVRGLLMMTVLFWGDNGGDDNVRCYVPLNGGEKVGNDHVIEFPSYATKLSPTSSTMDNLQKLKTNVPNDADYDVWLPLASVHKVNDRMKNSLYGSMDDPWNTYFLNKWLPSVSLLKEELSHVPVWVKFHDIPLVTYTSDGLSLMATNIGTLMMLDLYTNFLCFWNHVGGAAMQEL